MSHAPTPSVSGPTSVSQDFLAMSLAALMPVAGGLLVMIGFLWVSYFGAFLGAAGAVAWGAWWHNKQGSLFPKALQPSSVGGVAALVGLLAVIFAIAL